MALPSGALRCPSCGHERGQPVAVEVGRGSGSAISIGNDRSRRGVIAVVLVAALLGGVLLLSGTESKRERAGADSSTTTLTSEQATSTATTIATTTTSTTFEPMALGGPTGINLLVVSSNGTRVIELDTGVVHRVPGGDAFPPIGRAGGVLVSSGNEWQLVAPPYDHNRTVVGRNDALYASHDPSRVWEIRYGDPHIAAAEVDIFTGESGAAFSFPAGAQPVGAVDGGLVVSLYGGVYIASADGLRRIATGQAFASGGTNVLVVSCDDAGSCSPSIVDARTGRGRRIQDVAETGVNGYYQASFSPDGEELAIIPVSERGTPGKALYIIDTSSGSAHAVAGDPTSRPTGTPPAWSPDSAWVFWPGDVGIQALARGADAPVQLRVVTGFATAVAAF